MDVELRASDDDRHRVIAELQRHTSAGRLNLDEFSERVAVVWSARTLGDLAAVTRDLPVEPAPAGPSAEHGRRDLLVVFAVAVATLLLLGLLMALSR
ncbi:hypothetical protein C5N14_02425 [Micromonospora sp. MW-13]|uniref:DUF1707 SHOCT-like domain-containing protein n=1 Tax=unclassified Micromonospora TaxID=2617518 RepID=UPI000E444F59|nr:MULTISPECIES: DUF1707 domain-containing protein [unclassified Micromonospora]MCX4470030.1 DUF1707 domain-containing protein [Micromonospora sp. NBC_01655]RGC70706.1 hypothetical protein C5N14_02425 [Micromonospora sp. MW-13]